MSIILELDDVRGGYGEVDILNGITLSVRAGEILTVAGTNGAGKSTLAKAIIGLLPRVRGKITLGAKDLLPLTTEKRVKEGIGYVPQVANVFPSLTVLENLQVVAGVTDQGARISEMFDMFPSLADRRRRSAVTLSGGERQQLALARALMLRPKLMILDEPTAALAPAKVHEVFQLIRSLPQLGVSVFIVEQRARKSLSISDRGCILDGGCVALEGSAASLLTDDRAAELYLGRSGESTNPEIPNTELTQG